MNELKQYIDEYKDICQLVCGLPVISENGMTIPPFFHLDLLTIIYNSLTQQNFELVKRLIANTTQSFLDKLLEEFTNNFEEEDKKKLDITGEILLVLSDNYNLLNATILVNHLHKLIGYKMFECPERQQRSLKIIANILRHPKDNLDYETLDKLKNIYKDILDENPSEQIVKPITGVLINLSYNLGMKNLHLSLVNDEMLKYICNNLTINNLMLIKNEILSQSNRDEMSKYESFNFFINSLQLLLSYNNPGQKIEQLYCLFILENLSKQIKTSSTPDDINKLTTFLNCYLNENLNNPEITPNIQNIIRRLS